MFFSLSTLTNLLAESVGEPYELLFPLAIILFVSKSLSIICRRVKLPQVIGMLVTGILLGLITLIPNQTILSEYVREGLDDFAKIGVILIMFSAGVETDVKKIKSCGVSSIIITLGGVIFPILFGTLAAWLFFPKDSLLTNMFYGVVLCATSVSITVSSLKELGKLDTKVGTSIISAAIIDDVIGVVLLSLLISLSGSNGGTPTDVLVEVGMMILYFIFAFALGIIVKKVFNWLDDHYSNHRRIAIFGLALCFLYAYAAEAWFGVADITGAYVAGLILSGIRGTTEHEVNSTSYIDRKVEMGSYLFFQPVFFANIGLMLFDIEGFDLTYLWFGLVFVVAGILGKVIGAGLGAKVTKFNVSDSLKIGVGMMCRAEVVIVCAQKGVDAGIIPQQIIPYVLVLIIITSFVTPLILKALYKYDVKKEVTVSAE